MRHVTRTPISGEEILFQSKAWDVYCFRALLEPDAVRVGWAKANWVSRTRMAWVYYVENTDTGRRSRPFTAKAAAVAWIAQTLARQAVEETA